ncbi:MAG: lipopolysaccharide kinase InaA family protein [Gemmataceae bacterium]|nr:lipopolysaccharide kinase InaA family protein [Gemmataceae bacterium]MDW8266200.1 lipopolysaccharide kinase InaA family protein [Gemmataceae bacterium]
MPKLTVHPRAGPWLQQLGLRSAEDFLALPGTIVGGHPDRHVARVRLGPECDPIDAFLKREHWVPWKERLANAWAGFGFVSRSLREAQTLRAAAAAGIGCPEVLAAGEASDGRAFLLLRELVNTEELRTVLQRLGPGASGRGLWLARVLGRELARIHQAGFRHPDLYAKHVFVSPEGRVLFLDWSRAWRKGTVGWPERWRDLAALDATVADVLAGPRERMACLRAYLRACGWPAARRGGGPTVRTAAVAIRRHSTRLRQRRRIEEMRQRALPAGEQNLIWLAGEAICVTQQFRAILGQEVPGWLIEPGPTQIVANGAWTEVALPERRRALLRWRTVWRPLGRLWSWLSRRPLSCPEFERAGALFRLQRWGIRVPDVLAVGRRPAKGGRLASFLLVGHPAAPRLSEYARAMLEPWARHELTRQAAAVLQKLHAAGYVLNEEAGEEGWLQVQTDAEGSPTLVLGSPDAFQPCPHLNDERRRRDLALVCQELHSDLGSRTDRLRLLLSYYGTRRLTPTLKRRYWSWITTP